MEAIAIAELPIPAAVLARLPEALLAEFERVAGRARDAARAVRECEAELDAAEQEDARRERDASRAGRKLPAPRATVIESKLDQLQREAAAAQAALASVRADVDAEITDEVLEVVAEESEQVERAAIEQAFERLAEFEQVVAAAESAASTRLWALSLRETTERMGGIPPFADTGSAGQSLPSLPQLHNELDQRQRVALGEPFTPGAFVTEQVGAGQLRG